MPGGMLQAIAALVAAGLGVVLTGCGGRGASPVTITGHIFCDNNFTFYFNGELVKVDPIEFRPRQAVSVSFDWDGVSDKVYAISCWDFFVPPSGYEYTEDASSTRLGTGVLLAEFSDGTRTGADWKSYLAIHGPTQASTDAGCEADNLSLCELEYNEIPDGWFGMDFDDSAWIAPREFTEEELGPRGWGESPSNLRYENGKCYPFYEGLKGELVGDGYFATAATECLAPISVLCGGDGICSGDEGRFVWGQDLASLALDNQILFRKKIVMS